MPNILTLSVANPDQILNAGAYGAGAVIQVQSAALEAGPFSDDGTVPIVTAVTSYTYYDTDGTSSTWYRTRYENVAETTVSEWSTSFQPDQSTALVNYVTLADLKARLGSPVSTASDAVMTQICNETNQWIESYTGRILGPVASATYTFDGYGLVSPYVLSLGRLGARAVTLFETGSDGVTFSTVPSTRYALRPLAQDRALTGEPASYLFMTDGYRLPVGYGNIRITMTAGFAAIPDDVRGVAIAIATRAWHGRQSGQADIIGNTETGEPLVTKIIAPEFKRTLDHYRPVLVR